jgi:uncharacterized membrane protein YqaE (UPF0057 family)
MKKTLPLLALCILIVTGSCTIEKRLHQSGFHVVKNKKNFESSESINEKEALTVNQNDRIDHLENKVTTHARQEIIKSSDERKKPQIGLSSILEDENSNATIISNKTVSSANEKGETSVKKIYKVKNLKEIHKITKSKKADDVEFLLLVILAILLPPIAVGLVTNWDPRTTLLNVLLTLLCFVPGVIHALIVVFEEA